MKKVKLICLSLTSLLLLSLIGCSPSPSRIKHDNSTHFYEQISDTFLIDAEVFGFPTDSIPKVYKGDAIRFTNTEISSLLLSLDTTLDQWNTLDIPLTEAYEGYCSNEGYIYIENDGSGLYPNYLSYAHPLSDWWEDYYIYAGQSHYDNNPHAVFADRFTYPVDFAFATAQEAEASIRSTLSTLGFDDLILNRTLYIDHEVLTEISSILQEPEWQPIKDGTNSIKENWSDADDGYIFEFFLSVDNIPMFYGDISKDTYTYCGSSIVVWYQSSGIVHMTIAWPVLPASIAEEPTQMISSSEALSYAKEKLSSILTRKNTVITQISAEYIYVHDSNGFLLRPVWIIYATCEDASLSDYTYRDYVILDAITGYEY